MSTPRPMHAIRNQCDYGHATTGDVRLLPSGGGGNIIICQRHAVAQIRDWIQTHGTYTGPHWDALRPYESEWTLNQ